MKHYSSLINLETQIINLDALESLVRVLSPALKDGRPIDIENSMWIICDQIENIHKNLRSEFNFLFDELREESFKEEQKNATKARKSKTKK